MLPIRPKAQQESHRTWRLGVPGSGSTGDAQVVVNRRASPLRRRSPRIGGGLQRDKGHSLTPSIRSSISW